MKFIFNLLGTNNGGKFLEKYVGQEVEINSLYKDIEVNSPPLAIMKTNDGFQHSLQFIDTRIIDDAVFIQCFAIENNEKTGGKALIRLNPIVNLANIINPKLG
jgi:hypothetical protein